MSLWAFKVWKRILNLKNPKASGIEGALESPSILKVSRIKIQRGKVTGPRTPRE